MRYKIHYDTRNNTDYTCVKLDTLETVELNINDYLCDNHLFNGDMFAIDNNKITDLHSPIRMAKYISGILVLDTTTTYGKKNNKFLYKCIPDDNRIPIFLVPYSINNSSFSKKVHNIYVLFIFKEWPLDSQHPIGMITQNLGEVNILHNYYEYQLYCKSLHTSLTNFNKAARDKLKGNNNKYYIDAVLKENQIIHDRRNHNIFTIDPSGSTDLDDAMSITHHDGYNILSLYISNVSLWLEVLDLWPSFSERISTIYLPDHKRPMLPTILSDSLCSLICNEERFAFTMDIKITETEIIDVSFKNTLIVVTENYSYEQTELLNNADYKSIFKICANLCKEKKYNYMNKIKNSHDLVGYLMIMMNYFSSKNMYQYKNGIYRSVLKTNNVTIPSSIPENISNMIRIWNSYSGQYIEYGENMDHELLDMETYIHITSPIRRLVDLLNLLRFQWNNNLITQTETAKTFYNDWINRLDYINVTMRSIRKIQSDCNMLNLCITQSEILSRQFNGIMFDRVLRTDGLYHYIVYLSDLKITSRITLQTKHDNYTSATFKIFIFNDESSLKQKVRLHFDNLI